MSTSNRVLRATGSLRNAVDGLRFSDPVTHVYNPLDYARAPHTAYLRRFADSPKKVIFLGMNPGPFGMAQTGVPFGEIAAVRDWMGLEAEVGRPSPEHPKRPVQGFDCPRSEVSGRRLWGLFAERFGSADAFFADHFVTNYCPLVFLEDTGRNRTPDKLPAAEAAPLVEACDTFLRRLDAILTPEHWIGVGGFAEKRLRTVFGDDARIGRVLHPSPASPAANRGWPQVAIQQLEEQGLW